NLAHANNVAGDFDSEAAQQQLRESSGGNAGSGLARRCTLQHVASIREVELERSGEVGMTWPGRRYGAVLGWVAGFDRQLLLPVFPVAIDQLNRDGRADGLAMAHA